LRVPAATNGQRRIHRPRRFRQHQDNEEIMFNIKTIAFTAIIVLSAWGVAAVVGLGTLAVASSTGPAPQSISAPAIDTTGLMAKAGNLPVEIAPMP
jgi:hypothetical protein